MSEYIYWTFHNNKFNQSSRNNLNATYPNLIMSRYDTQVITINISQIPWEYEIDSFLWGILRMKNKQEP